MRLQKKVVFPLIVLLLFVSLSPNSLGEEIPQLPWRRYLQTHSTSEYATWSILYSNTSSASCTITTSNCSTYFSLADDCTLVWNTKAHTATLHWSDQLVEWTMCCYPLDNHPEPLIFTYYASDGSILHQDLVKLVCRSDGHWNVYMEAIHH